MAIAFLSHSSKNKPIVEELYKKLGPHNCVVDKYTFESGAKTISQIFENLEKTDLFVLIISNAALDSDWVRFEINQTKDHLDLSKIKRFLPINIDRNVTHNDPRIPTWISHNYDLKFVSNLNIIVGKIKRQLREIIIEANPKIAERITNFVGRNSLIEEFEDKYVNIENIKPTTIIVSGLEGVGRRSFLKKALEKNKLFAATYEPIPISLELADSIDDLILKLDEGHYSYKKDFIADLLSKDLNEKISFLKKMIIEYINSHEIIFIIDSGCLIGRTGEFNDWFLLLANSVEFENKISFCIISKYRPSRFEVTKLKHKQINQHVPPLSDADKEKLVIRIMNSRGISFEKNKLNTLLSFLNGFPEQIFYTADLIQEQGVDSVLKMREYINDYYDNKLLKQFKQIIENKNTKDIVIVLAQFGTVSYEYLVDIFYDNSHLDQALEELFTLGAYELVGIGKEFIKIDYALADYINRNNVETSSNTQSRIKHKISTIINDEADIPTYSDTLNTLKQGLISGQIIPSNLLLPSLVLKSISVLYDKREFKKLIDLANRVLENAQHIDKLIKREIHYFLCLAYARLKDDRFESEIKHFDFPETEFLYGLYHRIRRNYKKAKDHLRAAVKNMPNKIQARSELVLTLFALDQYNEAESLALENFNKHKNNPFYIQAYFKCLVHRQLRGVHEERTLEDLLNRISINPHPRAADMKLVMEAQYDYYINSDLEAAERKLKRSLNESENANNAFNVLYKIYQKEDNYKGINYLSQNFGEQSNNIDEE
ncbi:MAG: TIR domain-containing protein [Heyndrickxia sp.]